MTKPVVPVQRSKRMRAIRCGRRLACAALACSVLAGAVPIRAQTPTPTPNLVLLDPAHGGPDPGAHLSATLAEKDVTLALAARLKIALTAKGFSVATTRDADTGLTSVQRAEAANHAHPGACLLLHATSSGSGVYLAASSLPPQTDPRPVLPWETAQSFFLPQSLSLLEAIVRSVTALNSKPIVLRASVPPIDSLACAAVLVEVAPQGGKAVTDEGYQQRIVDGLADALVAWRAEQTPPKAPRPDAPGAAPSTAAPAPSGAGR